MKPMRPNIFREQDRLLTRQALERGDQDDPQVARIDNRRARRDVH
jgi:hypothetical protein